MASVVNTATSTTTTGTTRTLSMTLTSGVNLLIVATASSASAGPQGFSYAGVAMTKLLEVTTGDGSPTTRSIYYLKNPSIGTNNISLTGVSNTANILLSAISIQGASMSSPFADSGRTLGNFSSSTPFSYTPSNIGTTPSVFFDITSIAGSSTSSEVAQGAGQTLIGKGTLVASSAISSYISAVTTSKTVTYTRSSSTSKDVDSSYVIINADLPPDTTSDLVRGNQTGKPQVIFTGKDPTSGDITYEVQIDTVSTFNSQGTTPLIDALSASTTGFLNLVNTSDTDPFNSHNQMGFTPQTTSVSTYYIDGHVSFAYDSGDITNPNNLKDGNTATVATMISTSSSDVYVQGTNAPTSGGTISSVRARWHNGTTWSAYKTLTANSGGWTWSYISTKLAADIFTNGGVTSITLFDYDDYTPFDSLAAMTSTTISKIEVEVTSYSPTVLSAGTYYWRVRGKDPGGSGIFGDWSTTKFFQVNNSDSLALFIG